MSNLLILIGVIALGAVPLGCGLVMCRFLKVKDEKWEAPKC